MCLDLDRLHVSRCIIFDLLRWQSDRLPQALVVVASNGSPRLRIAEYWKRLSKFTARLLPLR